MEFKSLEVNTQAVQERKESELLESFNKNIYFLAEELVNLHETHLGSGNTAVVHFLPSVPEACFKIITNSSGPLKVNTVAEEQQFLLKVRSLVQTVNFPKPLFTLSAEYVVGSSEEIKKINILAMERVNGVSLRDILLGKIEIPEVLKDPVVIKSFFTKLWEFVRIINKNKIFHGDLHDGNIMVDIETGEPWVIDFGSSHEFPLVEEREIEQLDSSTLKEVVNKFGSFMVPHLKR